jgi:hypothetical protein
MFEKKFQYSFSQADMSNIKGSLGEKLIQSYIKKELVPALTKQGWDDVIFSPYTWFTPKLGSLVNHDFPQREREARFIISNGYYPTKEFLEYFKKLTRLLENTPDGFLIKLRKTGENKLSSEAINEFDLDSWTIGTLNHNEKLDSNKILLTVSGEIETIEVKTNKGASLQKPSYANILREGYLLRFFHVSLVSFEKNEFEIIEKLLSNETELEKLPL